MKPNQSQYYFEEMTEEPLYSNLWRTAQVNEALKGGLKKLAFICKHQNRHLEAK